MIRLFQCLVFGLLLAACSRPLVQAPAASSLPLSLALSDSSAAPRPDSLPSSPTRAVAGPAVVQVAGRKVKVKRGGTLIIQTGTGHQTSTQPAKVKNSTLASAPGATATNNQKAGNKADGGVALGEQSTASGSTQTKEAGWPWYVWLGGALAVLYGLYRLRKMLLG